MLWWFRTLFLHGWNHPFSNVCQSCSIYSSGCVFSHITVNMKLLSENLSVPIVLNFKHSLFDPILMVRIFEMGTILQSHMPNWQSIGHGRMGTILYKKMTHTQLSSVQNPSIHYTGLIIGILQHWHLDQSTFHPPPMLRCYHATGCRGPFLGLDLTWAIEALLRCGAGKTDFCGLCGLAWGWRRLWWLEVWSASPSKEPNTYCWLPPLHV